MLTHNSSRFLTAILVLLATMSISAPRLTAAPGDYTLSAHGDSANGVNKTAGYSIGNCGHCHEQHASRLGIEPFPPAASGPSDYMLFADLAGNALCNECHDGTPTSNISYQIAKTSGHDPLSTTFSNSTQFPTGYKDDGLNCSKCHNSHVAQAGSHTEMTAENLIIDKGPLRSVQGVKDNGNWSGVATPLAGTEDLGSTGFAALTSALVPITKEYELCFACHAGQLDADPQYPRLYVAQQFNPNNASVHPVVASAWNNAHLKSDPVGAMKDPWNVAGAVNKAMHCSDCHGSETDGEPEGPHGATNDFILKLVAPGDPPDALCNNCHNVLNSSAWISENQGYAAGRDHDLLAHQLAGGNTLGCIACHGGRSDDTLKSNIHGANYQWADDGVNPGLLSYSFIAGFGTDPEDITKHYSIGTARYCAAKCHTGDAAYRYRS